MISRFILNCYFVYYKHHENRLRKHPNLQSSTWFAAFMMLSVPIIVSSVTLFAFVFDILGIDFKINTTLYFSALALEEIFIYNLLFKRYNINKSLNGEQFNIKVTWKEITPAILFWVISFSFLLLRTYLKFGRLIN